MMAAGRLISTLAIKFTPTAIDGKPILTFVPLEYSFNPVLKRRHLG